MTEQTPPSKPEAPEVSEDSEVQDAQVSEQSDEQPEQEASESQSPTPGEEAESQGTPDASETPDADEKMSAAPKKEVPVPEDLDLRVEAALMTTDRAISVAKLTEILGGVAAKPIREAIDQLNKVYDESNRSFRIEQLAGGYQIVTLPKYAQVLANLHKSRQSNKLTAAAMETLAIIAYKQPILRAEIEAIRGVSSGETVRSLMERHLVKIVGRAEEIGRPMLYGTTKQFLEVFGLATLKDLPNAGELRPPKPRSLIPAKDELGEDGKAISDQKEEANEQDAEQEQTPPAENDETVTEQAQVADEVDEAQTPSDEQVESDDAAEQAIDTTETQDDEKTKQE
ncbi:MAG: SMC-Scp complex subunit ScpB [Phycisphaeraceae bacterium]|nr:SMC-Scp complex subunit ScpB [Phycisphaeraceae bacterium]